MSRKKRAFTFKGKIDLSDWDIPKIEELESDARSKFRQAIDKHLDNEYDKLEKEMRRVEERIRKTAGEALRILMEEDITIGFWEIGNHPERIRIEFPSLIYGDYAVDVDLREAIRACLLDCCDADDGYVTAKYEKSILGFAKMFDDISNELKTAIRPKETNA